MIKRREISNSTNVEKACSGNGENMLSHIHLFNLHVIKQNKDVTNHIIWWNAPAALVENDILYYIGLYRLCRISFLSLAVLGSDFRICLKTAVNWRWKNGGRSPEDVECLRRDHAWQSLRMDMVLQGTSSKERWTDNKKVHLTVDAWLAQRRPSPQTEWCISPYSIFSSHFRKSFKAY